MPKVKVTVAEKVFRTFEVELEIDDTISKEPLGDETFEDFFCNQENPKCIQDDTVDRDFTVQCAKCGEDFDVGGYDEITCYCEDCQFEVKQTTEQTFKAEAI